MSSNKAINQFSQNVELAAIASAQGKHTNAKSYLDNAQSFIVNIGATEFNSIKSALEVYRKLRRAYAGAGNNYIVKNEHTDKSKVVGENSMDSITLTIIETVLDQIAKNDRLDEISSATATNVMRARNAQYDKTGDKKYLKKAANAHSASISRLFRDHYKGKTQDDINRELVAAHDDAKKRGWSTESTNQKYRIGVTVSEPDHPVITMRGATKQRFIQVSASSNQEALERAKNYYKKQGYKVHDAHIANAL